MPILQKSTVKDRFAEWERFCDAHPDLTADQALGQAITEAEGELDEYVPGLSENTITKALEVRLMDLIRYHCFQFAHGDTEFDQPPAIVQDYNHTLQRLELYRTGDLPTPDTSPTTDEDKEKDVHIQAKRREFDDWFTKRRT